MSGDLPKKKRFSSRDIRGAYNRVKGKAGGADHSSEVDYYLRDASPKEIRAHKLEVQALAYDLLHSNWPGLIFEGALLYEKLGKGKRAVSRMENTLEISRKHRYGFVNYTYRDVEDFIKRNSDSGENSSELEGRVGIFLALTVGGLVLGVNALSATGNVVSSLAGISQGAAGVLFFVAGLAGMYFLLKKR